MVACVEWCPTHIVFVFILCFFVLCTLCCQFLWIVHFGCPFGSLKTLLTEAQQSRKRKG